MKNKDELVILFNNSNEAIVQNVQEILSNNNIPSVHISSGLRIPSPVGIRVRSCDYEKAKDLIRDINLAPLKDFSASSTKYKKTQRIGCFIYIGIALVYFILLILKEVL